MILVSDKVNDNTWNNAITETGAQGTIFQTTYWAGFLKKSYGDRSVYTMSLDKKGGIQGLLLAIESCYAKHPSLTLVGKPSFLFGQIFRKMVSPVFHGICRSIAVFSTVSFRIHYRWYSLMSMSVLGRLASLL